MKSDPSCAIVRTPLAPMFEEPRVASAQISQLVAGRCLDLLERRDDWYRVRGPDEYEGWLHRGYLSPAPEEGSRQSAHLDRVSLGCITTNGDGGRRAMPLGSLLSPEERVKSGEAIGIGEQVSSFPAEEGAITRSAQLYFEGTSYLWGGVTPWGADCSGLVQTTFWLHGIQLRRDAWQQAEQGDAGESDPLAARKGDLLFFSDQVDKHITHVAIALGNQRLVHLALGRGGYAVENLADERDPYVAKLHQRFVKARRVLTPMLLRV
ncbi:MAG TPA: C40 family peptidase [Gemmatimonadaceae bacterium]|nr:C40 family peptidase [Gemmatimonadaceae bacterium]